MSNRLFFILCFFVGFLIFVSCSRGEQVNQRLLRAKTLMNSFPDSSYSVLQEVPLNQLSKAEQMYYGLLLAEASDKNNFSLLPCDSLINEAVRYYDSEINHAKALMYKERIQRQMGMSKEAIGCCCTALKELGNTNKEEKVLLYLPMLGVFPRMLQVMIRMEISDIFNVMAKRVVLFMV